VSGRPPLPRRLRRGAFILAAMTVACIVGPWFAMDPAAITDPGAAGLLPPGSVRWIVTRRDGSSLTATRAEERDGTWVLQRRGTEVQLDATAVASVGRHRFWLGTDTVGRDVLARLLWGGRVSLAVGGVALVLALLLGTTVGLVAGWRGGLVDGLLMRLVDALLAVPLLFLMLFLAAVLRPSLPVLVLLLGFSSWMGVARLMRGQVLSLKEREFVLALKGIGASPVRIAVRHLLPNAATPLVQDAALRLGDLVLLEAALSFLGLGVQAPVPSWGNMVAQGGEVLGSAWWLTVPPGIAVALAVIAAALVADGVGELARAEGVPAA
jgi:peptide/nickel transport system permease protein